MATLTTFFNRTHILSKVKKPDAKNWSFGSLRRSGTLTDWRSSAKIGELVKDKAIFLVFAILASFRVLHFRSWKP